MDQKRAENRQKRDIKLSVYRKRIEAPTLGDPPERPVAHEAEDEEVEVDKRCGKIVEVGGVERQLRRRLSTHAGDRSLRER